jgi:hypothetical protein
MELSFSKKNLNTFFYFFWLISIIYLLYKIIKDFNHYVVEIRIEFDQLFFILIIFFVLANLNSYRFYFFLKKFNKCTINFIDWSKLLFKTSLMNILFQGSGHLLRAIELKKKNINYITFISINFFIFLLNLIFFSIISLLILLYLTSEKKIILLYLFILILLLFILVNKKNFLILINFIKNKLGFYKKKFTSILKIFLHNYDIFFLTKSILIFFFITLVMFILDFFTYFIIAKNILRSSSLFQIMLIFLFSLFLNNIPFLRNLFGINELLVGMFVEALDFYFLDGATIQLICRLMGGISLIIMSLFYYFLSLNQNTLK